MPLIQIDPKNPLIDGRQSARAMRIRRGIQQLFAEHDAAIVAELPLANGRRTDLTVLKRDGELVIIEIKSSIEDFRVDHKWPEYRDFCDALYFATLPDVPADIFPADCGLIIADDHGAEITRDAPLHKLAPPRRKAMTLRFARFAAKRLLVAEMAAGLV